MDSLKASSGVRLFIIPVLEGRPIADLAVHDLKKDVLILLLGFFLVGEGSHGNGVGLTIVGHAGSAGFDHFRPDDLTGIARARTDLG